jgi:2-methylisocitrate lyase-like PEP mutase family enzyme
MPSIIASGTTQILLATAVGVVAIIVGGIGVVATLGREDRGQLRTLLRHPVRTIFTEDEPDPED